MTQPKNIDEDWEKLMNRLFWRFVKVVGIPLGGVIVGGIVFYTQMIDHTRDGHPATVKALVHDQQVTLKEIQVTQGYIREDIAEIKTEVSGIKKKLAGIE